MFIFVQLIMRSSIGAICQKRNAFTKAPSERYVSRKEMHLPKLHRSDMSVEKKRKNK